MPFLLLDVEASATNRALAMEKALTKPASQRRTAKPVLRGKQSLLLSRLKMHCLEHPSVHTCVPRPTQDLPTDFSHKGSVYHGSKCVAAGEQKFPAFSLHIAPALQPQEMFTGPSALKELAKALAGQPTNAPLAQVSLTIRANCIPLCACRVCWCTCKIGSHI